MTRTPADDSVVSQHPHPAPGRYMTAGLCRKELAKSLTSAPLSDDAPLRHETAMRTHTYLNLRYGILHSVDYVCTTGHRIHEAFFTIHFDDLVWC